ncbi:DeoR/GlpR family DNA-binding transcription regulator [Erysipelothrix urinaevulpis]|uniref:DeoR/GlpR family DNA-binding transcription regulator n=1 Tax=Erysipelothrix urinaevulpis TaxID=2683717 RepID=UPI0013598E54|nr:DeoR/GlpR family DNA-binding transcription regulator [Erysipelothrix urinaevulpis]
MPHTRQAGIVDLLLQKQIVRVKDLSERYQVSPLTIRRDLDQLEKIGMIKRYYGGAILDESYADRMNMSSPISNLGEHHEIIKHALDLIKPGDVVAVTPSKIHETFCLMLPDKMDITVITNSMNVFEIIKDKFSRVILTGGSYMKSTNSFEGEETKEAMLRHTIDVALIGFNGIQDNTLFTGTMMEAIVKKSLIEHSKTKVVLLEKHKQNYKSNYKLCSIEAINYVVYSEQIQL